MCHVGKGKERSAKLKPKTAEKRLTKGERYSRISLSSSTPPHDNVERWIADASFAVLSSGKKVLSFMYDSRGIGIEIGLLADLVFRLSSLVQITYGYGFQRQFSKGPGYYIYDFQYGLDRASVEDREEARRINLWRDERVDYLSPGSFRHLSGLLRDVFPFNILTMPHLSQKVEGVRFDEWIAAREDRGRISPIAKDVWGWVVPDRLLPEIRTSLQAAGLLITRPIT